MKKRLLLYAIVTVAVVLAVAGFYYLPNGTAADGKTMNLPPQQKQFCQLLVDAVLKSGRLSDSIKYSNNDLRNDAVNAQIGQIEGKLWNDLYALIGPSGEFKDWRGGLRIVRNADPQLKGTFSVSLAYCNSRDLTSAELMTCNPSLYHGQAQIANTFIPANSPLAQQLGSIDTSRTVIASGKFVWEPVAQMEMEEKYHWMQHHFTSPRTQSKPNSGDANLLVSFTSVTQAP